MITSEEKAEIRAKQRKLSYDIQQLVDRFEKETQAFIIDIDIQRLRYVGNRSSAILVKPKVSFGELEEWDTPEC